MSFSIYYGRKIQISVPDYRIDMSGQSEQNIRAKAIETQGMIVRDKDKTWIVPNPKIGKKMEKASGRTSLIRSEIGL